MAKSAPKTVRFTQIVERSGQPHVHTLWLPPEKDPELKRAIAAGRVMTVESGAGGGKTDVGVVGFDAQHARDAQFLIFPKSVKAFDGARVVGIKFDLVEQPKFAAPGEIKRAALAAKPARGKGKRVVKPLPAVRTHEESPPPDEDADVVHFDESATKREELAKPAPTRTKEKKPKASAPSSSPAERALVREVRAALKELKAGKAVAAYERLQRAVEAR